MSDEEKNNSSSDTQWSHFNQNFLSKSVDKLSSDKKKYYQDVGERYLGYNKANLNETKSSFRTSTGEEVVIDDEYNLNEIIKCLKNGMEISDLEQYEIEFLMKISEKKKEDELTKWIEKYL